MKILSWNIAGGHTFTGAVEDSLNYEQDNLLYFEQQIQRVNPHIVALQEAHTNDEDHEQTQVGIIAKNLDYKYFENHPYGRSHIKEGNKLSLATLSKFPIVNSFFHKIPNPNLTTVRPNGDTWVTFDVGFLISTISYNEQEITVMNCHLAPFHYFKRDYNELEFQNIRDDITNLLMKFSKKPTIVLGDFNYAELRKILPEIFLNEDYREAFENVETTPGKGQQDHILYTSQWNLEKHEIRKANSDHHLCIADFKFD
jgi:endonuclease/exonuclease/phosphatase family metal-dependent hydrolase